MVNIAGRPYLEHQLDELRRQGITNVLLLTGYLGEQIEDYFGNGSKFGLTLRYCREDVPQGTGGGLRDAAHLLDSAFLVIYGDSYLPIRYADVVGRLSEDSRAVGLVVVYDNRESTDVPNNVALDDGGYVSCYSKNDPSVGNLRYVEAGVSAFRREIVEFLPSGRPVSLEQEAFPQLIARRQLLGLVTHERFYDIGTPDRLSAFESLLTK